MFSQAAVLLGDAGSSIHYIFDLIKTGKDSRAAIESGQGGERIWGGFLAVHHTVTVNEIFAVVLTPRCKYLALLFLETLKH